MTAVDTPTRERQSLPALHIGLRGRARAWFAVNKLSLVVGGLSVALVGWVHASGLAAYPNVVDDEGTYVAQAFAAERWHELTHYTYWYDHPPLGWLQIAGWTTLTGAFGRSAYAVAAGRESMLVAVVISAGLVFVLARHLDIRRPFAVLAVLLFGLSPLAIAFQRSVYLDNVAVPWLLGAFVLASSKRRHLGAAAGAAACFTVAVLSKETTLVLLPALVWQLWVSSDARTRRFVLAVFGGLFAALLLLYPFFAFLRNELLPGPGHVSLVWSANWQVFSRPSSGSILDPSSGIRGVLSNWAGLDPWVIAVGCVATPLGLAVRRLRPIAAALVIEVLMMLRGGYLPFPHVIVMLPFAALVFAGVLDAALRPHDVSDRAPLIRTAARPTRWVVAASAVAILLALTPSWIRGDATAMTTDPASATQQATQWVEANVPRTSVLAVDDGIWVDLVEHGFPRDQVLWFYKVDLDPAVTPAAGWAGLDYLVLGQPSAGQMEGSLPIISQAVAHSKVVAVFGDGPTTVTVRKVNK